MKKHPEARREAALRNLFSGMGVIFTIIFIVAIVGVAVLGNSFLVNTAIFSGVLALACLANLFLPPEWRELLDSGPCRESAYHDHNRNDHTWPGSPYYRPTDDH